MGVNKVNYGAKTVIDLSKDTVTASKLLKGITAHDKNGDKITGTYEAGSSGGTDTSDATAVASNILEEKTAYIASGKVTGTMQNRGATAGTISKKTGTYIIPEGYHNGDGSVTIAEAEREKIVPENIKNGITLLGVSGTYTGGDTVNPYKGKTIVAFGDSIIAGWGWKEGTGIVQPLKEKYPDGTWINNAESGANIAISNNPAHTPIISQIRSYTGQTARCNYI